MFRLEESEDLLKGHETDRDYSKRRDELPRRRFGSRAQTVLISIAVALLAANLFAMTITHLSADGLTRERSRFARLVRNVTVPIYGSTQYGPGIGTDEERNKLWHDLDDSPGLIALSDDYAQTHGLPPSMRFPWDQNKGVYLIGAWHAIHCLKKIQRYTSTAHAGDPDEAQYHHVQHCLDTLLQDVKCHADDWPWYQLPPDDQRGAYPEYQTRQCKNWDGLMKWARENNACYRGDVRNPDGSETMNEFEHYSYCTPDSPYYETMRDYFQRHPPTREGYV